MNFRFLDARNLNMLQRSFGGGTPIEEAIVLNTNGNSISQLGAAIANAQGIIDISNGQIIADVPKPKNLRVTVTSVAGTGDEDATISLFNNNTLTSLDTDNGSGAGSITYSWGDGYTGKGYEQLFRSNITQFAGKIYNGIGIRGFTLQVTTNSSGASNGSYFNTMDANIEMANLMGRDVPFAADLADAIRNTQYIAGTLTVIFPFVFNPWMQITYTQAPDTKFAWTFITEYGSIKL